VTNKSTEKRKRPFTCPLQWLKHDVTEYFSSLRKIVEKVDISHLIYNCAECGCQLNNRPTKGLSDNKGRTAYIPKFVTTLTCSNATDIVIPPKPKSRGKKIRSEFADGFRNGSLVTMFDSELSIRT